ncbi:adenosylcobinamide amidohydrolase [Halobacteriales archaeon QS_3_64_16]|nr:MAG: adenosylcobinamide amidohydrolase [Halobacteriales archaeon QS_3_64_16]
MDEHDTGRRAGDGDRDDRHPGDSDSLVETTVREEVLRVRRPGTRWLSSGRGGGFRVANAAYNCSVPTGFARTDLDAYVLERRRDASFPEPGPALLTGLSLRHARGAWSASVAAIATAGLSNPAALPISTGVEAEDEFDAAAVAGSGDRRRATGTDSESIEGLDDGAEDAATEDFPPTGTVNLVIVTDRALDDAGLTTLLASSVEAKTATLLALTGFSGTTSDAVVVGCDPAGERAGFAGSATPIGTAARACVRDAVRGSLRSRYPNGEVPRSVETAEYGVRTTRSTQPFHPSGW